MPVPRSSIAKFGSIERPLRAALKQVKTASIRIESAMRAKQKPDALVVLQFAHAECTRIEVLTREIIGRLFEVAGTTKGSGPPESLLPTSSPLTPEFQKALRDALEAHGRKQA